LHGMHVRLQLFTVPGQVYFGATRKLVLTGADGVVFVADSQPGRQDANQEALEDLVMNLAENNLALLSMPHTFHWNKRDIPDVVPIAELDRTLNRQGAPSLGTVATTGEGVFTGLERITRLVFQAYEAELPKSESVERAAAERGPIEDTTIADALRGLAEAPMRARPTPTDAVAPSKASPSSSRSSGAAPISSLESIPNPIPRRPTGSFEAASTAPTSSGQGAAPGSRATPSSRGRAETPAPAPVALDGSDAVRTAIPSPTPRLKTAPMLPAVVMPEEPPTDVSRASPPATLVAQPQPSAPHAPPVSAREDTKVRRETRDMIATSPPPPRDASAGAGHALSFAPLWQETDRDAARQAESALAAGDAPGALLVCDVLVTRLLASAAGLTGNAEAPRDPGLVVLLLGLDGGRYLAFRASVRAARAHDPLAIADALEAYVFTLEVRRALAAIGW